MQMLTYKYHATVFNIYCEKIHTSPYGLSIAGRLGHVDYEAQLDYPGCFLQTTKSCLYFFSYYLL